MATDTFTGNSGSGLWDDPANWTAGVPQSGSDVVIDAPATILASDPAYTVASLTTNDRAGGTALSDGGNLLVTGATTLQQGGITTTGSFGTTTWSGSGLTIGSGAGTGSATAAIGSALGSSMLPLGGLTIGSASSQTQIALAGTGAITSTGSFAGFLTNLNASGPAQVFLPNVSYLAGETVSFAPTSFNSATLTISSPNGAPAFTFDSVEAFNYVYQGRGASYPYPTTYVRVTTAAQGAGTLVDFAAPSYQYSVQCYTAGTAILTDAGERPIETLRVGDIVVTLSGARSPIRWIGQRSYSGRFLVGNVRVLPIRFRAGCLGGGLPRRDLLVSPDHAMVLQGQLVPARSLVNGDSIVQQAAVDRVEYYHLELDRHDAIFAEGAASETFVDDGRRAMFHNAADYAARYPQATVAPVRYCLPRLHDGEELEAMRRAIAELGRTAPSGLRGRIDGASSTLLEGWAWDQARPGQALELRVTDRGAVLGTCVASLFRPDLADAGIGDGWHAFRFTIPGGLPADLAHDLCVERASDGARLPNAPIRIEPTETASAPTAEAAPSLGTVDGSACDRIWGWAWNPASPHETVGLQVLDNGSLVARTAANRHRPDLEAAGIGQGWHGFEVMFPGGLSPLRRHVLRIVRESDGAELAGSPVILDPEHVFDTPLEQAVSQAVTALRERDDRSRALTFLASQTDRIRQHHAELDTGRRARIEAQRHGEWAGAGEGAEATPRALLVAREVDGVSGDIGTLIVGLQRNGYATSLIAADTLLASPASEAVAQAIAEAGAIWCGAPFYGSVEEMLRRQRGCFDVVLLCGDDMAQRYSSLTHHHQPAAKVVHLRRGLAGFDVGRAEQAFARRHSLREPRSASIG